MGNRRTEGASHGRDSNGRPGLELSLDSQHGNSEASFKSCEQPLQPFSLSSAASGLSSRCAWQVHRPRNVQSTREAEVSVYA